MAVHKSPKLPENALWEYALRVLGHRAHSAAQLRQKLSRRADSPATLSAVMEKLREYSFIDDQKFSDVFAASRLQNNGFGRLRVLQDLRARQVASTVAEEAVSKAFAGVEEHELIQQFLDRKYRSIDLKTFLQEEKNLASAYRRLRIAGFSSQGSLGALRRYNRRTEDWNEPEGLD
ncbi:MAG TPA: regulatory protein RecX [Bryobacteraceae bacterium]|nr:regulatory protein RecX [Bryobacteraceae bacterium]